MKDIGVYKFGGASIADIKRMKNVTQIIERCSSDKIVVVISAIGKTTNALEEVWKLRNEKEAAEIKMSSIVNSHKHVYTELIGQSSTALEEKLDSLGNIDHVDLSRDKHFVYDQIVSIGELMSTYIMSKYLNSIGIKACWLDSREMIKTNNTYRDGKVDWKTTEKNIKERVKDLTQEYDVIITQGFIGSDSVGNTTTLGREGSDYTAAIYAYCLDANEVSIFKDVQGILTADPRKFENVVKIDRLSYKESIEMTYYGAKVIHPKTIKPLQNKQIPLFVKSFVHPSEPGTMISSEIELAYPPIVVIEENQALLHFSTKDFSFVAEEHLAQLFSALNVNRLKVNLMKNTAISFSVCVTNAEDRIVNLTKNLNDEYRITVDANVELITVRHANDEIISSLKNEKVVLMEEITSDTVQIIVKDAPLMARKK